MLLELRWKALPAVVPAGLEESGKRFFQAPTPQENPWPGTEFRGKLNQELLNQSMVLPDPIFPKSDRTATPLALAARKVFLRDVRQQPAPAEARRADPSPCVWPLINELWRQTQCEA